MKATQWNLKCGLYEQLPFIYKLKLYALFINGKNETALYTHLTMYIYIYQLMMYIFLDKSLYS